MKIDKFYRYGMSGLNTLFKPQTVNINPIYVQVEPTSYCNLSCKTCGRDKIIEHPVNLKLEDFKKFIDMVRPLKIAMSGSGEPLINPDMFKMVKYAKERGCSVLTTSNLTLVTDERAIEIVESGLDLLKISIDASNRETYLNVRGKDYFDKVLDGIDKINKAKEKTGKTTPHLRLQFVILGDNFTEIPDVIKLAAEKKVEAVYLQPLILTYVEERRESLIGSFSADNLKKVLLSSANLAEERRVVTNIDRLLKNFDLCFLGEKVAKEKKRICIMPWFSFFLSARGDVRPCCSFATSEADLGNIFKEDFATIWNNMEYKRFREIIKKGKQPYQICRDCIPPTIEDIMAFKSVLPGFFNRKQGG